MKPIFGGYKLQFGLTNNIELHNVKIESCQCNKVVKKVKAHHDFDEQRQFESANWIKQLRPLKDGEHHFFINMLHEFIFKIKKKDNSLYPFGR